MPIYRSGYRSEEDKRELQRVYNQAAWKRARATVLARAGGKCEFCGLPADARSLDVVHLAASTLELKRSGADVYDVTRLAAGHRACHRKYSARQIPPPRF